MTHSFIFIFIASSISYWAENTLSGSDNSREGIRVSGKWAIYTKTSKTLSLLLRNCWLGHETQKSITLVQLIKRFDEDVNKGLWDYGEGDTLILKIRGGLHGKVDNWVGPLIYLFRFIKDLLAVRDIHLWVTWWARENLAVRKEAEKAIAAEKGAWANA